MERGSHRDSPHTNKQQAIALKTPDTKSDHNRPMKGSRFTPKSSHGSLAFLPLYLLSRVSFFFLYRADKTARISAEAAKAAVAITTKGFIATHRPRLILRAAFSSISDPLESNITVFYTIANIGTSVCWMTECHIGLDFIRQAGYPIFILTADQFPNIVPYIGPIEAGEHKLFTFIDPSQVWDRDHRDEWFRKDLGLFFTGRKSSSA
jgi:hypothetical protein